jgi:predicted nucleic acid-binding protein
MTFSSSPALVLERGLDTMILVYYLLQGHPAALPCEQFLRAHSGWFTSPLVPTEAKNILTKSTP